MAFEKIKSKSGRTPEQQAARDARKAAKKSAAAATVAEAEDTPAEIKTETAEAAAEAESSTAAGASGNERKRKHNEDVEELEVDLEAPTPLNKKEARLAKKKAKRAVDDPEAEEKEQKRAAALALPPPEKRNSVWIGNLSFRTTQERLKEFMEQGVTDLGGQGQGSVTRVNLPKEKGKGTFANNKGFAFVDFTTPELQNLAVGLSERLLEGRKVLIKLGTDRTVKEDARTPRPDKPKGLEKQPHAASATVFVGNLPFDATEEGLRDMIEASAAKGRPPPAPAPAVKQESEDDDEEEEVQAGPSRGGKQSGLRKVRLGAFEDTGRCKGFAFLDFKSPEEATAALTNRANRFYLGRRLILQYASEEATKRSGTARRQGDKSGGFAPRPKSRGAAVNPAAEEDSVAPPAEDRPKDSRGKKWEAAGRTAPGAALAAAKREKVGIVEGTGSRITFD